MPTLARACAHPGCRDHAQRGSTTCHAHRPATLPDAAPRETSARRGYDARWRRIRASVLYRSPLCVHCGAAATEVDHIVPLADGGTHAHSNLQPLCKPCHSRKTLDDNRAAGGRMGRRQGATAGRC